MDATTVVLIGLLVGLGLLGTYGVVLYNRLVAIKHQVAKAWSNIDVLLKQRHDELPKLVDTCKQYMGYEQETLTRVIQARSRVQEARQHGDVKELGAAEGLLRGGLGQLFALAEDYPELKADEHFQHLQQRVTGLEEGIADRREYYNEAVNTNNVRIEQFPDVVVARMMGFRAFDLLEFSEEETADVNLGALFGTA
jgi:LemA protein